MGFSRLLMAVDGSPICVNAVREGLDLARRLDAAVATVFAVEIPVAYAGDIGVPRHELLQIAERDDEAVRAVLRTDCGLAADAPHFVRVGRPADVIDAVAREWPADVIVMGSHGRGGLGRLLLGSVAAEVVSHAPCPVLIVRLPDRKRTPRAKDLADPVPG